MQAEKKRLKSCGMLNGRQGMQELDYGMVGNRIRQVRKAKGWSQDVLAKRSGISMSYMGHIERGTRIMSLETFVNICRALDANADEILWGAVHPSAAVLDLLEPSEKGKADSYSMYVRIMKSVAEIMSES